MTSAGALPSRAEPRTLPIRPRSRALLFALLLLVIALGLGSRRYAAYLPELVAMYAGDTLWGTMFFLGFCFLRPSISTRRAWLAAVLTTELIEFSELYRTPWLDAFRDTRLGGLMLGHTFLWSDVVCVAVGATLGALLDRRLRA